MTGVSRRSATPTFLRRHSTKCQLTDVLILRVQPTVIRGVQQNRSVWPYAAPLESVSFQNQATSSPGRPSFLSIWRACGKEERGMH